MKRPPYPAYKPSGVAWLGDVPAHWDVKRLKMAVQQVDKKVEADEDNPVPYIGMENIESWTGRLLSINPEVIPTGIANAFKAGQTLFGKLRPYLAKACNPEFDGLCSTELLALQSNVIDRQTLLYALLSDGFIKLVDSSTYGSKMPRANWDFIGNCVMPIAPPPEQRAIAAFLDRETSRLDTLIAKNHTLLERLKEKRTALISHTVTRGLNPDAKLKPSGVAWLGDVPAHWDVKRGRFVMQVNPPCPRFHALRPTDEVSFVPMESVGIMGGLNLDQSRELADISSGYTQFQDGDVVVAKITPCFENGKCALATGLRNGTGCGTTELHVLRAMGRLDAKFLFFLSISDTYRKLGEAEMYGAGGQKRVPPEFNKNFRTPLPPLPEQRAIADYLDRETATIDRLSAKIEVAINRLQEYRTALITAVVTGKIDVCDEKGHNSTSDSKSRGRNQTP